MQTLIDFTDPRPAARPTRGTEVLCRINAPRRQAGSAPPCPSHSTDPVIHYLKVLLKDTHPDGATAPLGCEPKGRARLVPAGRLLEAI